MRRNSHYRPVGSYPTLSPLPEKSPAVCSLLHLSYRRISSAAPLFSKGLPALCSPDFPQRRKNFSTPRLPASVTFKYNITTRERLCKKKTEIFLIIPAYRFSNNLSTCDFSGGEVSSHKQPKTYESYNVILQLTVLPKIKNVSKLVSSFPQRPQCPQEEPRKCPYKGANPQAGREFFHFPS